jgi:hypothetical protein
MIYCKLVMLSLRKKIHLRFRYSKLVMLAGSIEADTSFDNIEP